MQQQQNLNKMLAPKQQQQRTLVAGEADTLGPYDIVCGRCSTSFNNVGNRRFRVTIQLNLPRYAAANTRQQKGEVIRFVANLLRDEIGARFVKRDTKTGKYVELDDRHVRQKVGHALRDSLVQRSSMIRSNSFSSVSSTTTSASATVSTAVTATAPPPPPAPTAPTARLVTPPSPTTRKSLNIDITTNTAPQNQEQEQTKDMILKEASGAEPVISRTTIFSSATIMINSSNNVIVEEDNKDDLFAISKEKEINDIEKTVSVDTVEKESCKLFQQYLDNMPGDLECLENLLAIDSSTNSDGHDEEEIDDVGFWDTLSNTVFQLD